MLTREEIRFRYDNNQISFDEYSKLLKEILENESESEKYLDGFKMRETYAFMTTHKIALYKGFVDRHTFLFGGVMAYLTGKAVEIATSGTYEDIYKKAKGKFTGIIYNDEIKKIELWRKEGKSCMKITYLDDQLALSHCSKNNDYSYYFKKYYPNLIEEK